MGFITYKQADSRWGKKNYNGSSTMATAGCGPTACAMIAYGIDGKTTPLDTMKYMQSHGYAIRNNGTAWNGIPACLKAYGLQNVQDVPNMTKCWELMSKGYVGVFLFRKGSKGGITWTTSGHYIAVTDYKIQNGKHYIYTRDSGGRNHTGWYCYETQMKGLIPKIWLGSMPTTISKPTSTPAQSTSGKIYTGTFPTKTIKKGSKGTQVTRWQNFLKWMGYDLKADGKFGSITADKTKAAQKKFGFTGKDVDGIVGPKTIKKAKAYQKQVSPPSPITPAPAPAPSDLPKKCIDVSYWQGKISQANWEKIRKSCGYAICRASYTSQSKFSLNPDSTFATNFVNAKAAGLRVGAYHYSQAITVDEAKREAEYLCNILKNYTPTFYVVCDFEYGGRLNSKIGKKASDIANAFCDVVKAHGYNPCIYANTSTLNNALTNPKYPVWVAQYASSCTYKGSKVMWQYTSSGRVDGISASNTNNKSANVDLSHVYEVCANPAAPTPTPVPAPTPTPTPVVASKYTGEFPDLVVHSGQKIAYIGKALAYPKGTAKKTYTYGKGKATAAFTEAINKVYPKRSSWSKQCQAGASCDVGAGTVIRYSGYDTTIPRGLAEQIPHLQKSKIWTKTSLIKTSQMKAGDVGIYTGKTKGAHIWIGIGNGLIVEANHTAKYFLHVDTDNYTSSNKKVWGIYRACVASSIRKGDKGTEVTKLQKFLNWAGFDCGTVDGIFGDKTEKAVKGFQTRVELTSDGIFGNQSLEKAKLYTVQQNMETFTPPCYSS